MSTAAPEGWDAVVVGGGMAGLTAAWELTRAGLRPLLVEARGYTGGLVAGGAIAGVRMDLGAEGFVMRGQGVTSMVDALGLDVVGPSGGGARLFLPPLPGRADRAPQPGRVDRPNRSGWALHPFLADSFLGIPAHPGAADVVALLGAEAARRAARDAELDGSVGTGPDDPGDLASFVTARMGAGVLERAVRPIVAGIHTADPADLDADTVAPGLREATARLGSLQAAVGELLERRRARRRAGRAADVTVPGGLMVLADRLRAEIEAAGGAVLTRTGAQDLLAADDGMWELTVAPTGRGPTPSAEPVPTGPSRVVRTRRCVLACSAAAALRLLRGVGVDTDLQVPVGSPIARFTLVVRAPGLAGAPVGSGLLVAPTAGGPGGAEGPGAASCPVRAKALSHLSVKWPWIGRELEQRHGPGVHALRLSYSRPDEPYPEVDLDMALEDVAVLTGVRIPREDVIDSLLVRWDGTLPPVTPAYRERTARLLDEVGGAASGVAAAAMGRSQGRRALPGLAVTGAWVAGTGIAAVVEHARAQAARLAGPAR